MTAGIEADEAFVTGKDNIHLGYQTITLSPLNGDYNTQGGMKRVYWKNKKNKNCTGQL